ncbi:hypothetical protein MKX03_036302 [Papaver bracteatum]|nr:hypothetical protein MKX03_036302 [Papaver bracteatum]
MTDANKNKKIEMGEASTPVEVMEDDKNKKKVADLVETSKSAEVIERKEMKLAKPSKLVEMIDRLNLKKEDFYEALLDPLRIFIIPTYIKRRDQAYYEPKMVSIGPYHYGKPQLEPMQRHKERALIHFLKRKPEIKIEQYQKELKHVVNDLRGCYEMVDELEKWKVDEDFVKLMLLDGVFLFEFLNVLRGNQASRDYAAIDPIFGNRGHNLNYNYVMEDLLLLENQIPYKVLSTLLMVSETLDDKAAESTLSSLMLAPPKYKGHHLLDMYIKGMLGERNDQQPNTGESNVKIAASKLSMLGIKFRKVGTYSDIKFDRNNKTLCLPSIVINQHTVPRFFNSKAYELRAGTNKDLNSYIHLVDFLIQSTEDVSSLRSQGIILSSLVKDEDVVEVMKELTKDTVPGDVDDKSTKIVEEVTAYYQDKEGKVSTFWIWVADNWASLLFAGFLLYALAAVQAVYSALSFHYRNK